MATPTSAVAPQGLYSGAAPAPSAANGSHAGAARGTPTQRYNLRSNTNQAFHPSTVQPPRTHQASPHRYNPTPPAAYGGNYPAAPSVAYGGDGGNHYAASPYSAPPMTGSAQAGTSYASVHADYERDASRQVMAQRAPSPAIQQQAMAAVNRPAAAGPRAAESGRQQLARSAENNRQWQQTTPGAPAPAGSTARPLSAGRPHPSNSQSPGAVVPRQRAAPTKRVPATVGAHVERKENNDDDDDDYSGSDSDSGGSDMDSDEESGSDDDSDGSLSEPDSDVEGDAVGDDERIYTVSAGRLSPGDRLSSRSAGRAGDRDPNRAASAKRHTQDPASGPESDGSDCASGDSDGHVSGDESDGSGESDDEEEEDAMGYQCLQVLCRKWGPLRQNLQDIENKVKTLRTVRGEVRQRLIKVMDSHKRTSGYVQLSDGSYLMASIEPARASLSMNPKLIHRAIRHHTAPERALACLQARLSASSYAAAGNRKKRGGDDLSDDEGPDPWASFLSLETSTEPGAANVTSNETSSREQGENRDQQEGAGTNDARSTPGRPARFVLVDDSPERDRPAVKEHAPNGQEQSTHQNPSPLNDRDGEKAPLSAQSNQKVAESGKKAERQREGGPLLRDILSDMVVSATREAQQRVSQGKKRVVLTLREPSFGRQMRPLVIDLDSVDDLMPSGSADALDAFLKDPTTPPPSPVPKSPRPTQEGGGAPKQGALASTRPGTRVCDEIIGDATRGARFQPLPYGAVRHAKRLHEVQKKIGDHLAAMRPLRQQIAALTIDLPPPPPPPMGPASGGDRDTVQGAGAQAMGGMGKPKTTKREQRAQEAAARAAERHARHAQYQQARSMVARYVANHSRTRASQQQRSATPADGEKDDRVAGIPIQFSGSPTLYRLGTTVRSHVPPITRTLYPSLVRDAAAMVLQQAGYEPDKTAFDERALARLLAQPSIRRQLVDAIQQVVARYRQAHARQSHRLVLSRVSSKDEAA